MRGRGGPGRGGTSGRGLDMTMNMAAGQGASIPMMGGRGMRGGMAAGGMAGRTMMGGGFVPRGGYQPR